jgi:hypothetical protein
MAELFATGWCYCWIWHDYKGQGLYSDSQATFLLSASYNGADRLNAYIKFDVLALVNIKIIILWDVSLVPWSWKQQAPFKQNLCNALHGIISQVPDILANFRFWFSLCVYVGWDSVVDIVTCYRLDSLGIESWCGKEFCTYPDWPWGPPSLMYEYRVIPGSKVVGCGVNHPPQSSTAIKERVYL